jgi:monothiol glutaredoxin
MDGRNSCGLRNCRSCQQLAAAEIWAKTLADHPEVGVPQMEKEERAMSAETTIRDTITKNDVVLFMKGTKMMPQCGFSSRVAGVLNFMGVEFADVNVLADAEIRQGIKDFSDWPTIPQLYVKGEFVGGCDIVTEMTLSGELDQLLEAKGVAFDKAAAEKIREANA